MLAALKARGIDRTAYSRAGFITTVVTAMREAVGTDLLSVAAAQEILNAVLGRERSSPANAVAVRIAQRQRNTAMMRVAALLILLTVAVSAGVTVLLNRSTPLPTASVAEPVPSSITDEMGMTAAETVAAPSTIDTASTVPPTTAERLAAGAKNPTVPLPSDTLPRETEATASYAADRTSPAVSTTANPVTATLGTTATTRITATAAPVPTRPSITVPTAFVPDYREGHANTVGNDPNSLARTSGRIAKQDNWLYFCDPCLQMVCKLDLTSGQTVPIYDGDACWLNAVGDWLYLFDQHAILRMHTDGSNVERLASGVFVRCMAVRGQELFYTNENVRSDLRVIDLTTRRTSTLCQDVCNSAITVCDAGVFYTVPDKDRNNPWGCKLYLYQDGASHLVGESCNPDGVGHRVWYGYIYGLDDPLAAYDYETGQSQVVCTVGDLVIGRERSRLAFWEMKDVLIGLDIQLAIDLKDPTYTWQFARYHGMNEAPTVSALLDGYVYWDKWWDDDGTRYGTLYRNRWNGRGFDDPEELYQFTAVAYS